MPEKTLEATFDHGVITGDTVTGAYADAHEVFDALAAAGHRPTPTSPQVLEDEGVEKFIASWHELLETVAHRARRRPSSERSSIHLTGHVKALVARDAARPDRRPRRVRHHRGRRVAVGPGGRGRGIASVSAGSRRSPVSRPLVARDRGAARRTRRRRASTRVVLAGMGGSSLAPEVIAQTSGVPSSILDSTAPGQVLAALDGDAEAGGLEQTVLVVSSKSGSTVETDSAKRALRGGVPRRRASTRSSGSSSSPTRARPLDQAARADGYRVFNADPNVGGRYSALTAFGLVPTGLAGVDIARAARRGRGDACSRSPIDSADNPGARPGRGDRRHRHAAARQARPRRPTAPHIVGFARLGRAARRRVAPASTAPASCRSCSLPVSPEVENPPADVQIVRLVDDGERVPPPRASPTARSLVSGSLGAQLVRLGVRDRGRRPAAGHQPVRPARRRVRQDRRPRPARRPPGTGRAGVHVDGVEVRVSDAGSRGIRNRRRRRCDALLGAARPTTATSSIQAYVDRLRRPAARRACASSSPRDSRPPDHVRLGTALPALDRPVPQGRPRRRRVPADHRAAPTWTSQIPGRPFTFGQLIPAQAAGDAAVLADHGRPVRHPAPSPTPRPRCSRSSKPLNRSHPT